MHRAILLRSLCCLDLRLRQAARRGRAACGLAALAGPTALLTQFGVPRPDAGPRAARLPERLVARVVAGPALPALVGRADTLLVIGVEGDDPAGDQARIRRAGARSIRRRREA